MERRLTSFLSAALAIRLLGLGAAAIWFDESVSYYRAQMPLQLYAADFSDYVGANVWELVLHVVAGGPAWLFRIPSLIAAMLALWIAWVLMDRLQFSSAQQITAAVPLALLPGMIWQAQDARYYAAITLLYVAALYFAVSWRRLGLLACLGMLPYVHPIGALYAGSALLVAWIRGMPFRRVAAVGALALVSYVPRIYSMIHPGGPRQTFWLGELTFKHALAGTVQAFMVGTIDNGSAIALLWLLLFAAIAAVVRISQRSARILLAATMLPIIGMLAVSLVKPIYFYRPVQPVVAPFCMLIGLTMAPGRRWPSWIAASIGASVLLTGMIAWDPAMRGSHLDAAAAFIARNWHAGDHIAHAAATTAVPFSLYADDRESCMIEGYGPDRLPSNLVMPYCDGVGSWLVWSRDDNIMQPDLSAKLYMITAGHLPVWRSDYAWQMAPIEIYYLQR